MYADSLYFKVVFDLLLFNCLLSLLLSSLICSYGPILLKGIHKVVIQDAQGVTHSLSRYYAMWNKPRPESLTIVRPSNLYCKKN